MKEINISPEKTIELIKFLDQSEQYFYNEDKNRIRILRDEILSNFPNPWGRIEISDHAKERWGSRIDETKGLPRQKARIRNEILKAVLKNKVQQISHDKFVMKKDNKDFVLVVKKASGKKNRMNLVTCYEGNEFDMKCESPSFVDRIKKLLYIK